MEDRKGIEVLIFLSLVALFALFGASARILYRWEPQVRGISRTIGNLMVSVFAAWLIGMSLWDQMHTKPMLLMAVTGAAAWFGGDVIDRIAKWLLGGRGGE